MNWINPREKLPKDGELVWVLVVENDYNEKGFPERGEYPVAEIHTCVAEKDRWGLIRFGRLHYKGYSHSEIPVYNVQYAYNFSYDLDLNNHCLEMKPYQDDRVRAWMPFDRDDIPLWKDLSMEESIELISKTDYLKIREIDRAVINSRKEQDSQFIRISDGYPTFDGVFVVANKDGVWLSRYEQKTCQPWIAPNGKKVEAWYPVPDNY